MRFSILACGIVAVIAIGTLTGFAASQNTKDSLETVKKNVAEKKAVLVDVREKSEWDEGHIEGSIFLPLSALKKGLTKEQLAKVLPKDRILYTFCMVGKRAITAEDIFEKFGYEGRSLKPGYKELVKAGFRTDEKKK